jgi:hypothetical protein
MHIADNNHVDVDINLIMRMQTRKSDNRIMQMRILLIIASAFLPLVIMI